MRRTHASRIPPTRRQLAFEPLEPRELLAADVGVDWWSSWDSPTADDWSWTFDDASGYDTAGAGSWGDDAWWAGDVAWDVPADGGAGYGSDDGTGFDAGGTDWTVDFGVPDAASTTDVVTPPVPEETAGSTNAPPTTVVDVAIPEPSAPQPEPTVVVVSPDVETAVDLPVPVGGDSDPGVAVEPAAEEVEEPIVVIADGGVTTEDEVGTGWDIATAGDATAADGAQEDADAGDPVPTDVVDVTNGDVPDDEGDVTWVYDTLDDPSPADGVPSEPPADTGDDPVVEVVVDVVADAVADSFGEPTVVVVTPIARGPVRSADVPVVPSRPAATGIDGSRFAAWAAGFMQAFWRPAGDSDGSLAGGLASGQTGTGRPRIRLPFRPIV